MLSLIVAEKHAFYGNAHHRDKVYEVLYKYERINHSIIILINV